MADSATGGDGINAAPLGPSFNESVNAPVALTREAGADRSTTASAEIEARAETQLSLDQHDDRWRQINDRLSNRVVMEPSMELGGSSPRSIPREYTAQRQQWETQRDALEANGISATADIRAQGTTLTRTHADAVNDAYRDVKTATAPTPEPAPDNRFQREFSVNAIAPDKGIER